MALRLNLGAGQNPHVNYEPSILGGLREALGKVALALPPSVPPLVAPLNRF